MNFLSDNTSKRGTSHGARKFYDLPDLENPNAEPENAKKSDDILRYIDENIVGKDKIFSGPYGLRKAVYCDYTASGRSLAFIEDYIREQVLEDYGNTHTTTTVTSLQTTLFRHEARDIVRNAVNASEHDSVIFVGSGCTGAVHKLINALHLQQPPVVFVGPYEHHSNLLPWRELAEEVICVKETAKGEVDIDHLTYLLKCYQFSSRQLIGCFSAASNVSGTLVAVDRITEVLHKNGALAFWDYATAAPYVNIDMNPVTPTGAAYLEKDAIFISTHKFVGGVQTPGILIAKKKLFRNPVPTEGGGGSVFFVRQGGHRYLQEVEMREEGGTPAIVESIRAGLVFQLKEAVGTHLIQQRDEEIIEYAHETWLSCSNLQLLGNPALDKLPIFSFVVRNPESGYLLHHNFVCAVLNDVFGVQARGGCACAGPYAQELLGIDEKLAKRYEEVLLEDSRLDRTHLRRYREYSQNELLRPGFTRLNVPYFMDDDEIDFVIQAVAMTAEHAWKLLPQYNFNPETGEWRQKNHQVFRDRKWLAHVTYRSGEMMYRQPRPPPSKGEQPQSAQHCLELAEQLFDEADQVQVQLSDQAAIFSSPEVKDLRWFLLPSEAYYYLTGNGPVPPFPEAFPLIPLKYPRGGTKTNWQNEAKIYIYQEPDPVEKIRKLVKYVDENFDFSDPEDTTPIEVKTVAEKPPGREPGDKIEPFRKGEFKIPPMETASQSKPKPKPKVELPIQLPSSKKKKKKPPPSLHEIRSSVEEEVDVWKMMASMPIKPPEPKLFELPEKVIVSSEKDSDFNTGMEEGLSKGFKGQEEVTEDNTESKEQEMEEEPPLVPVEKKSSIIKLIATFGNDNNKKDSDSKDEEKSPQKEEEPVAKKAKCIDGACLQKRDTNAADKVDAKTTAAGVTTGYKWFAPHKSIFKPMCEAITEYNMLQEGDKVLVCLSGGKDSLSLLHGLHQYQFYAASKGLKFTLGAVTVDPMTSSYDPSPLKAYLAALELPYFYEEQNILESAEKLSYEVASICSYCSRMKRGRLYHAARREGYNVLAMGQHLDDLAESFLMSVFHNGILRTMKASYSVQEGDLRVIRPFAYVREKDLRQFAEKKKLPVISENCPACFEAPKERHRMKQLLASQEVLHARLFPSLQTALRPLMALSSAKDSTRKLMETLLQQHGVNDDDDDDEVVGEGVLGSDARVVVANGKGDAGGLNTTTAKDTVAASTTIENNMDVDDKDTTAQGVKAKTQSSSSGKRAENSNMLYDPFHAMSYAGEDCDDEDVTENRAGVTLAEQKGAMRYAEVVAMKLAHQEGKVDGEKKKEVTEGKDEERVDEPMEEEDV